MTQNKHKPKKIPTAIIAIWPQPLLFPEDNYLTEPFP